MKENVGPLLALYPMPVAVIGAMNGEKPTWTLATHMGIIGHDRILVSLAAPHFINGCIKKEGKLSVNLVDEAMSPEADEAGAQSGHRADKSTLFVWDTGEHGVPIIKKSPLTMECTVTDKYTTNGFESFICAIDATYVDEKHLDAQGKINYATLKPVMFEFPTYSYLSTGGVLGKCLSFKNNDSRGHVQ